MFRIRLGQSWKTHPDTVARLRALGEGRGRGSSPRQLVDTLAFEVDGIDLAQGLAEAPLFEALTDLGRAARTLAAGPGTERLAWPGSLEELRFARDDDELQLTLVVRDGDALHTRGVREDPQRFLAAVRRAIAMFVADLESLHPGLPATRAVRRLVEEAAAPLRRARPALLDTSPAPSSAALGGARLSLALGGTRLAILGPESGQTLWMAAGAPKRALARLAELALGSPAPPGLERVELLPGGQSVRFGRQFSCSFSDLRRSVRTLAARTEGWPGEGDEALEEAVARLDARVFSEAPVRLAPPARSQPTPARVRSGLRTEGLRRLVLRRAWRLDTPGPRPRLARLERDLLVSTSRGVERRGRDGSLVWSAPLAQAVPWVRAAGELVLGRDRRGAVVVLDSAGRRLMRVPPPAALRVPALVPAGDARVLLVAREGLGSLALSGGLGWLVEAPDEGRRKVVADASIVLVGNENGIVQGLSAATGRGWRTASGLAHLEWLGLDRQRGQALASGEDERGEAVLVALGLADGRARWVSRVDGGGRLGAAVTLGDRVVAGGETRSGPHLAAVALEDGRALWERAVPGDGQATPVAVGSRVLVPRCGGGLAAFSRGGRLLFHTAAGDPDPALSPRKPRLPALGAGLVVVLGAWVQVVDAASGRPVALLEPSEFAPTEALVLDGPTLVVAPEHGPYVEAWQPSGHLRVLAGGAPQPA